MVRTKLRTVKVYFTNGTSLTTNMAARLTNKEIRSYYRVGKVFNIGAGPNDRLTKVKRVKIID